MVIRMEEEEVQTVIKGANQIAKSVGRSIPTIIKMKHTHNLPMYLMGGIWEMELADFEDWKECQKNEEFYEKNVDKETPLSDTTKKTKKKNS